MHVSRESESISKCATYKLFYRNNKARFGQGQSYERFCNARKPGKRSYPVNEAHPSLGAGV